MNLGESQATTARETALNRISEQVIGGAIEVHRALGPGLLESVYHECLAIEMSDRGLACISQARVPVVYKGRTVSQDLKIDLLVESAVIVELKSVEDLFAVHQAQVLTYLKMTGLPLGLLINFNVSLLRNGVRRFVGDAAKDYLAGPE